MARLVATSKAILKSTLAQLVADRVGIRHPSWGPVDCRTTYIRNVKEPATTDGSKRTYTPPSHQLHPHYPYLCAVCARTRVG